MVIRARFSKEHSINNYVMKYTIYILYLLRIERESKAKSLDFSARLTGYCRYSRLLNFGDWRILGVPFTCCQVIGG